MLPGAAVQTANGALSRVEQTKRFAILPVSWEPGGDQVTPAIKLKRQAIAARAQSWAAGRHSASAEPGQVRTGPDLRQG
jgi:long-subunit acyl-CoA synthetase (AMP-forming)